MTTVTAHIADLPSCYARASRLFDAYLAAPENAAFMREYNAAQLSYLELLFDITTRGVKAKRAALEGQLNDLEAAAKDYAFGHVPLLDGRTVVIPASGTVVGTQGGLAYAEMPDGRRFDIPAIPLIQLRGAFARAVTEGPQDITALQDAAKPVTLAHLEAPSFTAGRRPVPAR